MGRSDRSGRSRPYTGQHPHHDHLHIELTPEAAEQGYPWWQTGMEGPNSEGCGVPIPIDGAIIDNEDDCFTAFGPAEFWRTENEGYGGTLRWTNAWKNDTASNWARWNLNFETPGTYLVEYHSVSQWAVYDSASYSVGANGAESSIVLDQSAGYDGWNELGKFDFAEGGNQWVDLIDNTEISVPADQHIIADAIRITPIDDYDETPDGGSGKGPKGDDVDDEDSGGIEDPSVGEGGCSVGAATPSIWILAFGFLVAHVRRRRSS